MTSRGFARFPIRRSRPTERGWAYVVEWGDTDEDKPTGDIWMTSWDGKRQVQLTSSKESDSIRASAPDGRWLAFLSARGDEDDDDPTQVWLLDRNGGEARALTELDGDVEDFAWSPDSKSARDDREGPRSEHAGEEEPQD
jgi:dipeptidyl aminopeptidase/acylaminoacyl peptidase